MERQATATTSKLLLSVALLLALSVPLTAAQRLQIRWNGNDSEARYNGDLSSAPSIPLLESTTAATLTSLPTDWLAFQKLESLELLLLHAGNSSATATYTSNSDQETILTYTQTRTVVYDTGSVAWHGAILSDASTSFTGTAATSSQVGFCLIYRNPQGRLSGTITTATTTYSILTATDDTNALLLRATPWAVLPDETHSDLEGDGSNTIVVPNLTSVSVLDTPSSVVSVQPGTASVIQHFDNSDRRFLLRSNRRYLASENTVDILVVVTHSAMCEYAGEEVGCNRQTYQGAILDKIALLRAEFDNAVQSVGVEMNLRVSEIRILNRNAQTDAMSPNTEALNFMANDAQIASWRDEAHADLVNLITSMDPITRSCGRARPDGVQSAVAWPCLEAYSWTHELGHAFGANHDIDNVHRPSDLPTKYAFGYRQESSHRTVMAYSCPLLQSCPRIPIFSSRDYKYQGKKLGGKDQDNAKRLDDRAETVASWRTAPEDPDSDEVDLLCPASEECPGQNLMNVDFFGLFCLPLCFPQGLAALMQLFVGFECGAC